MPRVELPPGQGDAPRRRPAAHPQHTEPASASPSHAAAAPPAGRTLTFVTGNAGKVAELSALLAPLGIQVAADGRGYPEVQAGTLREVTEAGAKHLLDSGLRPPFILEDSGLFVAALKGFPGVYSRYALDTLGIAGLLQLLRGVELETRTAAFQADLAYVDPTGAVHHFAGACRGRIAERPSGSNGFGFDPVFVPEGHPLTFADMDPAEKSRLSHRGQAVMLLARHLASRAASP
ncbi:MAG: RdgB/HAM1 family non-canonical purine NTP pyrophosphatase [Halobacteriales archaeon]|nr:RdgB/HAM1 family non-canonical purine NTP pyrophosphatase [Halobacteriales archaeon]